MDLRGRRRRRIQTKIETHHKQIFSGAPQEQERQEQEREERIAMLARVAAEFKAEWNKNEPIWRAEAKAMQERIEAGEDPEYVRNYSYLAAQAAEFRDNWNAMYSPYFGCFEQTTKLPNMPFTYKKPGRNQSATTATTLQIISLKVARIRGGLQWPFHVFGMVAIRDMVDHNRNIIFDRPRHYCQILTQEVPYLQLTGPTRAVVLDNSVTFEVDLKVKGATESEDECMSFLAANYTDFQSRKSHLFKRQYAGKLSTLEFELGSMIYSVEATISVRVTSGSWPDGFRAQFSASTESLGDAEIILLDSGDDKVPVVGHLGSIKLSRCVVSVEVYGRLRLSVKAWNSGGDIVARRKKAFKAKSAGPSVGTLDVGFCKMSVNIAWSLISAWY